LQEMQFQILQKDELENMIQQK
jgi:hypothetical protein